MRCVCRLPGAAEQCPRIASCKPSLHLCCSWGSVVVHSRVHSPTSIDERSVASEAHLVVAYGRCCAHKMCIVVMYPMQKTT